MKHGCPWEAKLSKLNQVKSSECLWKQPKEYSGCLISGGSKYLVIARLIFFSEVWDTEGSWTCYSVKVQGSILPLSLPMRLASLPSSKTPLCLTSLGFLSNSKRIRRKILLLEKITLPKMSTSQFRNVQPPYHNCCPVQMPCKHISLVWR